MPIKTTLIESGVSTAAVPCWAQTDNGWLLRVNGAARGSIWKGVSGVAPVPLGLTAPAAAPTIAAVGSGGALYRGTYYCGYRYLDADGVPSSLSPLATVSVVKNDSLNWSNLATGETRATKVQLFRSTEGQATTLYLAATLDNGTGTHGGDGASDAALMAAAKLPILNDDRSLCARRFGVPPSAAFAVVPYRDRHFYIAPEGIYYSYPGEPESVPATQNLLKFPINADDNDELVGAFSSEWLWILKQRHVYLLTFSGDPRLSGAMRLVYARGALNQRCCAMLEGVLYLLDEAGPWRMSAEEAAEPISLEVHDYFRDGRVLWSQSSTFFVSADPVERIVRYHLHMQGFASAAYPSACLAYNLADRTWHVEDYGRGLSCAAKTPAAGRVRALFGTTSGDVLVSGEGWADYITAGITGTVTGATANTLVDAGATFTSVWIGSRVTLTSGAGSNQTRTVVDAADHTLTIDSAWGTVPAVGDTYMLGSTPFSWRSGNLPLPLADERGKRIGSYDLVLQYKPTASAQWLTLRLYFDHDQTPARMGVSQKNDQVRMLADGRIEVNLGGTVGSWGLAPGTLRLRFEARSEARLLTHESVSVSLAGAQGNEEVTIYDVRIEPAGG